MEQIFHRNTRDNMPWSPWNETLQNQSVYRREYRRNALDAMSCLVLSYSANGHDRSILHYVSILHCYVSILHCYVSILHCYVSIYLRLRWVHYNKHIVVQITRDNLFHNKVCHCVHKMLHILVPFHSKNM